MAAFGYLIYMVRVSTPWRSRELNRLSAAGSDGVDYLDAVEKYINALGIKYHKEAKSSEGYRLRSCERSGRLLSITINKGPEGATGETYDTNTGESVETTESIALLSGLRAALFIPTDSYYGLLFVERIGIRNLKEVINNVALKPAASDASVVLRVESFAEAKDWKSVLEPRQTLLVSELLRVKDSGDDASTPKDATVKIIAEGGLVKKASDAIKSLLGQRLDGREERLDLQARVADLKTQSYAAGDDAFTVQDQADLKAAEGALDAMDAPSQTGDELLGVLRSTVPVETGTLQHQRYEVGLGIDKPERTFIVEGSAIPQFVYELGARLTNNVLLAAWTAHAESILKNRGVTLPAGWLTTTGAANGSGSSA